MGTEAPKQVLPSSRAEQDQGSRSTTKPLPAILTPRGMSNAHKVAAVLRHITHLAHVRPLSFRALQVTMGLNETFQGPQEVSQSLGQGNAASVRIPTQEQLPVPIIITITSALEEEQSPEHTAHGMASGAQPEHGSSLFAQQQITEKF